MKLVPESEVFIKYESVSESVYKFLNLKMLYAL